MLRSLSLIMPTDNQFGHLPVFLQSVATGLLPGLSRRHITLDGVVVDYSPNSDTLTAAFACQHLLPVRLLSVAPVSGLQGAILAGLHAVPAQHAAIVVDVAQGIDRVQALLTVLQAGGSWVQFDHPPTQNWPMGLSVDTVQVVRRMTTLPMGPQWVQWVGGIQLPAVGPAPTRQVVGSMPSFRSPVYAGLTIGVVGVWLGWWWPWVWGLAWVWTGMMVAWGWVRWQQWANQKALPAYRLCPLPAHLQGGGTVSDPSTLPALPTPRRRRSRSRRGAQTPRLSPPPAPPSD